jgi:glutamate N-acetyltransferase/amino-acid N-acetyltransferase
VTLTATGHSEFMISPTTADEAQAFQSALTELATELAQDIVRDGEGATKFVAIEVSGATSVAEADSVARTVAHSPLVKTALFASDPNWGRILAAIGRAGLEDLDVDAVSLSINGVLIAENGARAESYTEQAGVAAMAPEDLLISINLARGNETATIWTTDFSYDYVKINAEYRT